MSSRLMTTKEVAEYLGVSEALLNGYRAGGIGPVYLKFGRLVRYRVEDLEKWMSEQAVK
jgi:excisionase family DNA binding protein